ncbi:MAG: glycosyltransferase family 1 protein [Candidatus Microsaccharimonas sossegonensis]|uniref:Glycosyltransferase family 1 protein n=1 Tax=Candidatus Microsaccharimonas sossegonensis TaxID=2506948 RepID=A0A4V1J7G9_9BACT|nr:MAG: glycosyltransferase family 1 protein [Candidatus Microsaccharimonas sossegonensis]
MKLLYDARYIRTDFHDGISRYSTELGKALAKITDVTFLIFDPAQIQFLPKKATFEYIHAPTSPLEPFTAHILNKFEPDVVFSPMQTMGTIGRDYKLILTSHDMIYYRHSTPPNNIHGLLRLGWRLYHLTYIPQRLTLNAADIVTTVSSTVQREFEHAKLTKRPIVVIPNAPQTFHTHKVIHLDAPKNLIYMGSFMPYKNVELLIKGMEWLPGRTLHLLSKIAPARRKALTKLIPKGADVRFHGGVTDDAYEALLADNAVLVSASFDEGYGLPIAEALAMGVPAVISNIPIFHEVAAGGALYFDPMNPKQFTDRIKELDDKETLQQLIKIGKEHIATFTWDASARTLLSTIHSLL